jgi:hypothetical protein
VPVRFLTNGTVEEFTMRLAVKEATGDDFRRASEANPNDRDTLAVFSDWLRDRVVRARPG